MYGTTISVICIQFRRTTYLMPNTEKPYDRNCSISKSVQRWSHADCSLSEPFNDDEVLCEIRGLKAGKSPGNDGITNEQIQHGGPVLVRCIRLLFNKVYDEVYIPGSMKHGLIYTLYKGSNKYEDGRKNYSISYDDI